MRKLNILIILLWSSSFLQANIDFGELNQQYLSESLAHDRCVIKNEEFESWLDPFAPLEEIFERIVLIPLSTSSHISIMYHRKSQKPYILKEYQFPQWTPGYLRKYIYPIHQVTENEFRVGLHLHHPSLVRYQHMMIKYTSIYGWQYFLILEFLDETKRPTLSTEKHLEQLLTGLLHIYEQGIVPYDALPYNVLITKKGDLKLIDFGFYTFEWSPDLPHTLDEYLNQLLKLIQPFTSPSLFNYAYEKAAEFRLKKNLSKNEIISILHEFVQELLVIHLTEECHAS